MNSAMILVLLAALLFHTSDVTGQRPTIWQTIDGDNRLTILATAMKAAGLDAASPQGVSFTVFAPTNEAFSKVPQELVQRLSDPQNKKELTDLLIYHVIGDRALTSAELTGMNLPARLETLTGDSVIVTKQGNQVKINDATVVASDIMASNGIIHIIDKVLMPKSSGK